MRHAATARVLLAALAASVPLFALAALSRPASAIGVTRLEVLTQSVKTSDQSAVAGLGFRAHLEGGDLNSGFVLVPSIEYWRDQDVLEDLGIVKAVQRDWRFGADLRYRLKQDQGSWTPYVGAGLGLHLIHSYADVQPAGQPGYTKEDDGNKLAPNLLVGVDFPAAGPIRNSVEFNWHLVPDLKQFKLNIGIGWRFGPRPEEEVKQ
jgi:hypothetical protein